MIVINGKTDVKNNRGTAMNAHQYGRSSPSRPGFVPISRVIGEILDDLDYSMSDIGEIIDYAVRNGTVEDYPFFKKEWHRETIEQILPEAPEDRWSVYSGRWETV